MRIALISDIHGNLEALYAVLEAIDRDIDPSKGDRIWCLGDIIGYGPNPVECVELVARRCEWSLLGNHDYAALYEPTNFNKAAEEAAYWTRRQFEEETRRDQARGSRLWEFLGRLRVRVKEGPFLCVHGSPRKPINEYLFPEDGHKASRMQPIFDRFEWVCLVGHTHVPGVFGTEDFFSPANPDHMKDGVYEFRQGEKAIVNPGSVGQPRDTVPLASYAIMDVDGDMPRQVRFHRIPYDIETVKNKIFSIPELDNWLGERLLQGR